jgi:hypothetical protein
MNTLFGTYMSIPESAANYMNTLYSFGVSSNTNQQGTSSSTIHVDLNAEEIQDLRRGQCICRPPPCGVYEKNKLFITPSAPFYKR